MDQPMLGRTLLGIARDAIETRLAGMPWHPDALPPEHDVPAGVFVTLWARDDLRGCIGHIEPVRDSLATEVAECARLAAFRDPRFEPVTTAEMPEVSVEVSVLTPTERVDDLSTLDPRRWGVVVSCGDRRGVLLPDVRGVDTVDKQLSIALRKGAIGTDEPWVVDRFEVLKFYEEPPHSGST